jgi:hypothetical protein
MQEKSIKKRVKATRVFRENPYDLETIFETLSIASSNDKELIYVDRLITELRLNPDGDLTSINYRILNDLNLIKLP